MQRHKYPRYKTCVSVDIERVAVVGTLLTPAANATLLELMTVAEEIAGYGAATAS
jgi:hypothetical protein